MGPYPTNSTFPDKQMTPQIVPLFSIGLFAVGGTTQHERTRSSAPSLRRSLKPSPAKSEHKNPHEWQRLFLTAAGKALDKQLRGKVSCAINTMLSPASASEMGICDLFLGPFLSTRAPAHQTNSKLLHQGEGLF